jgi:hypothetical protein
MKLRDFTSILLLAYFISQPMLLQSQESKDDKREGLKISGYVQAQYQHFFIADSLGGAPDHFAKFSGGDVSNLYTNDRFQLRRGRLKFSHFSEFTEANLSFDFSDKGFAVKDLYVKAYDPWLNAFSLTGGIFNRPFGYEIDYSSSLRETPERSRVIQTLFPNEREVGMRAGFRMPESSGLNFFSLDAALVNGNGSAVETNNYKDFIGHIHFNIPREEDQTIYAGLGFSMYKGKVEHMYNPSDSSGSRFYYIYEFGDIDTIYHPTYDTDSAISYTGYKPNFELSTVSENMLTSVDRNYFGIDAQLEVKTPFGKLKVYGEYLWGTQPATIATAYLDKYGTIYHSMNSFSPTGPALGIAWPSYDNPRPYDAKTLGTTFKPHHTIIRNFSGGYITFIQEIFESGHEIVIKYDWYDPNTAISGKDIVLNFVEDDASAFTYMSPADLKYTSLGLGWNWNMNEHLKFSLYYEYVKNEISSIPAFTDKLINEGQWPAPAYDRDVMDDVFTFRIQYKF